MLSEASSLPKPWDVGRLERRGDPERFFRGTIAARPLGARAGADRGGRGQTGRDGGDGDGRGRRGAGDRGPRGAAARAAHGVRGVPRRGARRVQDAADAGRRGGRLPGEKRDGGSGRDRGRDRVGHLGRRGGSTRGRVVSSATEVGAGAGRSAFPGEPREPAAVETREGGGSFPSPPPGVRGPAGLPPPHSHRRPRRGALRQGAPAAPRPRTAGTVA